MSEQLVAHTCRPAWGLAIRAWRRDGQCGYQFEDGTLRKIAESHTHLLEPVDVTSDRERKTLSKLTEMAGLTMARNARSHDEGEPLLSLDEQTAILLHQFEDGFEGDAWRKFVRGSGASRRLKRHREAAIRQAQALFSREELDRLMETMRHHEVVERAVELLEGTSLVDKRQLKPLQNIDTTRHRAFAEALRDLLHGEGRYKLRFTRLVQALRSRDSQPSWALVTAIPALLAPSEQICVRPSIFREQAKWMAPRLTLENQPNAKQYERVLRMANSVKEKLSERELAPQDLLDVYDFMWHTLRPSARKLLDEIDQPAESQVRSQSNERTRNAEAA